MADEQAKIEVEQISQNYLIDPMDLMTNQEKAESAFIDMKLPESEPVTLAGTINDFLKNVNVNKTLTPKEIMQLQKEEPVATTKELEKLKNDMLNTVTPAIKNLYSVTTSLARDRPSPSFFTEARPTYNGSNFYFDDENVRVTQHFPWS